MADPIPAWFALEINGRIVFSTLQNVREIKSRRLPGQL
jgi:hypothetical protein